METYPPGLKKAVKILASLELTLVCIGLLMVLITACTLEQASLGTFASVDKYFRSAFLYMSLGPVRLPVLPAGGAVGLLLLGNLVAAFITRFELRRRKTGIYLTHLGLVVLVLGEFLTGMTAVESRLAFEEGQSMDYVESPRADELYLVDASDAGADTVFAVPTSGLRPGRTLSRDGWPFTLTVREAYANASVGPRPAGLPPSLADQGAGAGLVVRGESPVARDDERDMPAAFVEIKEGEKSLGTWLAATTLSASQEFTAGGRRWLIGMRAARRYLPFTLTLKDFRHDVYPGTQIPKNFSSLVRLTNAATGEDRDVLIWMNNPLRYMGRTFYQASFGKNDTLSVLQVVENPAWLMPYVSFGLMTLGLLVHFLAQLLAFKPVAPAPKAPMALPPLKKTAAAALLLAFAASGADANPVKEFGRLPVLDGGRVKPLDSVARTVLLELRGKQSLRHEGRSLSPAEWLLEAVARPREADRMEVFRIDDPDVLGLLNQRGDRRYFAFEVVAPKVDELDAQARRADGVEPGQRTRFERAVLELHRKVSVYQRLKNTFAPDDTAGLTAELAAYEAAVAALGSFSSAHAEAKLKPAQREALNRLMPLAQRWEFMVEAALFRPVPPAAGAPAEAWTNPGEAVLAPLATASPLPPALKAYAAALDAWRVSDRAAFAARTRELSVLFKTERPAEAGRARREALFNAVAPFTLGMALYVLVFLAACGSWLAWPERLRSAAFWLMAAALLVHTGGILGRMLIQGRPPVTNLYSSAVFVGWGAALLALGLEYFHRRGWAAAVGSVVGFCTLVVAHHLAMSGDTMEMMQAVLDSNFWLATHVITITIGYSATFLAGALALGWIGANALGRLTRDASRSLTQMTYGTLCFALFFSFVGTVLGGIWADQSWGRFWGWDPKENGALLLVLWIAAILHARWAGQVRERGLMVMAVFGNVVTAMAWFGVNMLGVGLHSYGFMDKAVVWLALFTAAQFAAMAVGARNAAPGEAA
jgi:ABC-type transport system involved in cytochrome c biogenesis permease subunit